MNIQFCLPIQKSNTSEIEEIIAIEKKRGDYAYFEIWIDFIENLDEKFLKKLISDLDSQIILLFRRPHLEPIHMPIEKRKLFITTLYQSGEKALLDLDISQKEELDYIKENKYNLSLLISYHNYQETPQDQKLQDIIDTMEQYNPFMYKIATQCNSDGDVLRIMQLMQKLKNKKKKYIIIGMGEKGKITRIYGMLNGNVFNYAPRTIDEQSAKGQIIIEDMKKIYEILK